MTLVIKRPGRLMEQIQYFVFFPLQSTLYQEPSTGVKRLVHWLDINMVCEERFMQQVTREFISQAFTMMEVDLVSYIVLENHPLGFKHCESECFMFHSYTPRTLRACCSQSKFRILKIRESSARALFLYNCTPNISRSADASVRVA